MFHRLDYTKSKLNKMYSSVSPLCDRCKSSDGTHAHTFCFCPEISEFWKNIFQWYSNVFGEDISPDIELALFGCYDPDPIYSCQTLICFMFVYK